MTITQLIQRIHNTADCVVRPASGNPLLSKDHILPSDVRTFYSICGGVSLFQTSEYAIDIVEPTGFVRANPVIFGDIFPEPGISMSNTLDAVSWTWYILVGGPGTNDYATIDCSRKRNGRCYYSNWASHAMVGQSPIIAWSFTQFLTSILNGQGGQWYWERSGYKSLGDAYDNF